MKAEQRKSDYRTDQKSRRGFLRATGIASTAFCVSNSQSVLADDANFDGWRTFEVLTRVEVSKPSGKTHIWVPLPLSASTPYQKTLANNITCEGGSTRVIEKRADALGIVAAEFPEMVQPILTVTSRVATKNYVANLSAPGKALKTNPAELKYFLRSTKLLTTDGIVREMAAEITKGAKRDIDKAHAIYDWIVENAHRNPKTRGCGLGNIRFMLESKDLGGKCADLNALYVGLARAGGLPARDVYGIRVARSERGFRSLGTSSDNVTKAQHCRAEVYISDIGWIPVDPADVRKVMLEEPPGNRPLDDDMVRKARVQLFGSWEMNWIAYNFGHDVALPGSSGPPIGFLMYPQAETSEGRLDSLDPDSFKYEIKSKEIGEPLA